MTEIIDILKKYTDGKQNTEKVEISVFQLKRIIKALEQDPCEDAISRKKVIDTIYCECSCENLDIDFAKVLLLQRAIKAIPPVTPQSLNPETDREESKAYCAECDHIEMCSWYPHDGCEWLKTDRYNAGYNAAKKEIALSGEYERAYERGKQAAEQTRWIPVSERLPKDKCKDYLACGDDGYIATIMYGGNGRWLIDDCKIIAWMPLTEPYKKSEG